jgi:hypothetical protein
LTDGDWPEPVGRHLRRPLLWLPVAIAAFGIAAVTDAANARAWDEAYDRGFHLDAEVHADNGPEVLVSYANPLVGRVTEAELVLWSAERPDVGERLRIDVDPDDPYLVVRAGDRYEPTLWVYPLFAALPLVAFAIRSMGLHRVRSLAARPTAAFAMSGRLRVQGRRRRRVVLDLYALDAARGSRPLCSVPLLHTAGLPLEGSPFLVEVKGSPRSFGRVVAAVDGAILWPRGRALTTSKAGAIGAPTVAPRFPAAVDRPAPKVCAHPWDALDAIAGIAAAVAAVVVGAVTTVTLAHGDQAAALERDGLHVTAEIVGRDDAGGRLDVQYRHGGRDEVVAARAPVDFPEDWEIGRRYPAVVDPDQPDRIRLRTESYDALEPVLWAAAPAGVAWSWGASRVAFRRRARRAADGPWRAMVLRPSTAGGRASIYLPGAVTPSCDVTVPWSWWATAGGHADRPVSVSELPAPGLAMALRVDDHVLLPLRSNHVPERSGLAPPTSDPVAWPPPPPPA